MEKFLIRATSPWSEPHANDVTFGWAKTEAAARRRAQALSRNIRTDCAVYVESAGTVLAKTGTNSGPGGGFARPLV